MIEHYTILTDKGASKTAEAFRIGQKIEITQIALGDGNGQLPQPQSNVTSLVNERYRAPINSAKVDENNSSWVVFEQVLTPDVGGWWIREVGLYDKDGDLIAVGNYPEQYKPLLTEGASITQTISIVIQVLSSEAITLKVDPSVVLATRQYVEEEVKKYNNQIKIDLGEVKNKLGDASAMQHSGMPLDDLVGSATDVADAAQLVNLRNKFQGLKEGANRSVSGEGDLITTNYLKDKCIYKYFSVDFTTSSDYTMRPVKGTDVLISESGRYIFMGGVRAWGEMTDCAKAATFWMTTFMRKDELLVPGFSGVNTGVGNKDTTVPIFGMVDLKAGDIVTTGFLHNQGIPWDKVHLYSSLLLLKIGE